MKLEEQAEQANGPISEFLAMKSHEQHTQLNAIPGFSETLGKQYLGQLGPEKSKDYARDIHSSASHLLALVNGILNISAIEAVKATLDKVRLTCWQSSMAAFTRLVQL